jgi:hypothetical protein
MMVDEVSKIIISITITANSNKGVAEFKQQYL